MNIDPFIDPVCPITLCDAVGAIMVLDDGRYLLQLRDPKPEICYPSHWGLFGGAREAGESDLEAVVRELTEETGLTFKAENSEYFTTLNFDLAFAGGPVINRVFFEVPIHGSDLVNLKLGEGQQAKAFSAKEALSDIRMTPYDSFALWMHFSRKRFVF